MRLHHFGLAFIAFTITIMVLLFVRNHNVKQAYSQSAKCENELTSSLLDAMTDAIDKDGNGINIFDSEGKRRYAYDEFYRTLSLNLNEYLTKDTYIQDTIPALYLVDTNGYYVVFREEDNNNNLKTLVSPITPWTEYVGNGLYVIRYYLDDYVSVADRTTGVHYDGSLSEVKEALTQDGLSFVFDSYIHDLSTYEANREYVVWKAMEESLNYYVNRYNTNHLYCYDLTIPMSTGIQTGHPIDKPCMFALMQGKYFGISGTSANIYAYANYFSSIWYS